MLRLRKTKPYRLVRRFAVKVGLSVGRGVVYKLKEDSRLFGMLSSRAMRDAAAKEALHTATFKLEDNDEISAMIVDALTGIAIEVRVCATDVDTKVDVETDTCVYIYVVSQNPDGSDNLVHIPVYTGSLKRLLVTAAMSQTCTLNTDEEGTVEQQDDPLSKLTGRTGHAA